MQEPPDNISEITIGEARRAMALDQAVKLAGALFEVAWGAGEGPDDFVLRTATRFELYLVGEPDA